jgi:hypothetical protein
MQQTDGLIRNQTTAAHLDAIRFQHWRTLVKQAKHHQAKRTSKAAASTRRHELNELDEVDGSAEF